MTRPLSVLPPTSAQQIAIAALARQGQYGVVAGLARDHGIGRRRVYQLRDRGAAALEEEFAEQADADEAADRAFTLQVTEADIARTVIALRVVTPSSIRDEVAMLPIIYGTGWSFGKIQAVLVQAEQHAAAFNAQVDLSQITHVALDEMFSQGFPVLGGIDIDAGFLFLLEKCPSRTGAEWTEVLGGLQHDQGFAPRVVVKDAGEAMAKAVGTCFPEAEQRDDLFHALYLMGQVAHHFERRAYATIAQADELERKRRSARSEPERRSLGQQVRIAREHTEGAVARYDRFELARREAQRLLQLTDRGDGRLRAAAEVEVGLARVADAMHELGGRARKVATYVRNRAAGLARHFEALRANLDTVAAQIGGQEVVDAVVRAWQASVEVGQGGPWWDRRARRQELDAAVGNLIEKLRRDPERLRDALGAVLPIIARRHRASSAIENLNSVLRPYLVVHKGVQQGFLDLFRFYWNTRIREWGPHKGTSAYEMLTGKRVADWLTLLRYAPGEVHAAAA